MRCSLSHERDGVYFFAYPWYNTIDLWLVMEPLEHFLLVPIKRKHMWYHIQSASENWGEGSTGTQNFFISAWKTWEIPRKKSKGVMKTQKTILSGQYSIEFFRKHIESEKSSVTFLTGWLPILLLWLEGIQNYPEAEDHLKCNKYSKFSVRRLTLV